jgi:putative signal transducing protein
MAMPPSRALRSTYSNRQSVPMLARAAARPARARCQAAAPDAGRRTHGAVLRSRAVFELVCPQCSRTYEDGATACEDCDVPLVVRFVGSRDSAAADRSDGAVVELTLLPTMQAEIVATRLRAEGIPAAVFAAGFAAWMLNELTGARRVMVLERDRDHAQEILDDLFSSDELAVSFDDDELAAQAEAADPSTDPDTGAAV